MRILLGKDKYIRLENLFFKDPPFWWYLKDGIPRGSFLFTMQNHNLKFISPKEDAWVIREVFIGNVYDRFFTPIKGSIVVDIGAHVGIYSHKASRIVGSNGLVISLEPHPENYQLLLLNLELNKIDNVIPLKLAAGEYNGKINLYISSSSVRHSTKMESKDYPSGKIIEVDCVKVDEIINKLELERVDILKVDVEGAEMEVLKGAEKVLKNNIQIVIAAYHSEGEVSEVEEFLKARGFMTKSTLDGFVYAKNW